MQELTKSQYFLNWLLLSTNEFQSRFQVKQKTQGLRWYISLHLYEVGGLKSTDCNPDTVSQHVNVYVCTEVEV